MANVTFSSPVMAKDITVYAVAGHRGTVLAIAKAHKIPIPFDCQDGECGSCLVEIKHLSPTVRYGIGLTEKEKEVLRQLGKITPEEIKDAEVNDMPPRYRLACQCFIRDEDVLVSFEGDQVLPARKPGLSIAAAIYKGGVEIRSLDEFLSYAVKVEEDAVLHFDGLSAKMADAGNSDVAELFQKLAGYSRLHRDQARARCRATQVTVNLPPSSAWPDQETPERTDLWAGDPRLSRIDALKAALQGERRGFEFYYVVAGTAKDPDVSAMAKEFVREENEHVELLKQWILKEDGLTRAQTAGV